MQEQNHSMDRVLVIGSPGAGKSTFARKLRKKTGLPLFYLDQIWHLPDRTNVTRKVFDTRLEEILSLDRFLIDGNYMRTLPRRLAAADTVFFLDYDVETCLSGIRSRIGTEREDLPWIEDALEEEFLSFVRSFPSLQRPKILEYLQAVGKEVRIHMFSVRAEADAFLASVSQRI